MSEVTNYKTFHPNCRFLVSEPKRYLLTHLIIWVAMVLYYSVTAQSSPLPMLVVTAALNLMIEVLLLAIGMTDPGMIPKVLQRYEREELKGIPLDQDYRNGAMRDQQKMYVFALKCHSLRVKFCSSCYIFRPPRTSHCSDCNMCV